MNAGPATRATEAHITMTEILAPQPNSNELVFIDLSSIAHPIWHMSQAEPDANHASQAIVARVRALANSHPHVAVCCDSGRSFRKDIADSYKANRPPAEAMLGHQITLACEQLQADGFPVWSVKGFEADDLIASATVLALGCGAERTALIVSADKDLLQLVGPRVRAMSARDGAVLDADAVYAKLGVRPEQVRDYLALVGDSSDNVKGAAGIGPKRAADLLKQYGTLAGIYAALQEHPTRFTPAVATALKAFAAVPPGATDSACTLAQKLVSLRSDVELPFTEIFEPRIPKEVASFGMDDGDDEAPAVAPVPAAGGESVPNGEESAQPSTQIARIGEVPPVEHVSVEPAEYERQLDPRSMKDAITLSKNMYESRLFSSYGTPQAVLSTVMLGRELGLPAMASLRGVHIVEGRHALSAQLMVALVLKSGFAEYFEPVEFNDQHAVWVTKRKGARKEVQLEHTIQMAEIAGLVKDKSNWKKVPIDMLNARCQSRLARMVYPDIVGGLYTPDELSELREAVA